MTLIYANVLTLLVLIAALAYKHRTERSKYPKCTENLKPYIGRSGVILYCIQGGKSVASRRHARGNWEPGEEDYNGTIA